MKLEIDKAGIRVEVNFASVRAALRALLPLLTALVALASAPEVARLGALLGWW